MGETTSAPADILALDALALSAAIRDRTISCVELMTATLDRIDRLNPKVNAIVALQDRDVLLAQARERDQAVAKDAVVGPLHGLPMAIKDLEPVRGIRTTFGSPIFADFVPTEDSIMVERLRGAGAIFIGKTNTPEFGLGSQTYNRVYGATGNAYDPSRTAGGSSGGAAVAVALRLTAVADGSDFGGSLRNPPGWNNVFGLRPSFGRIAASGRDVWLPGMSVLGPIARTVPDLAMLLAVQAGHDPRAPLSSREDPSMFASTLDRDIKGLRVAWLGDFDGVMPFEPGVLDVCRGALDVFRDLGCIVEEARPDFRLDKLWEAWRVLRAWQTGANLHDHYADPARRPLLKPEAVFEIESGLGLDAYAVTEASVVRTAWSHAVRRFFERYDAFILPTAQVFPFDVTQPWPNDIAGHRMQTYYDWMQVAIPVTMSGCPAVAAPVGFGPQGLPMGIQIVTPNRDERAGLEIAQAYDRATQWPLRRPPHLIEA